MSFTELRQHDRDRWHALAGRAVEKPETRHFIDGDWVDSVDGGRFETVNPATGEVIAAVSAGTVKDIDRAVASAMAAFQSGAWSKMAPRRRMKVMYGFADLVAEHAEELAVLESLDMGKPIRDVINVDLPLVCETIRFMAECIDKVDGSVTNTASDVLHMVLREPLGVVGAITPWNFPMLMAAWKFAPALAAGNSVVLKPAEQSSLTSARLAELFVRAGGPAGVFNVVNGIGEVAGQALALHNDVAKISFTGSTAVGKLMLQYAGQSNMKHVGLECGGKSPHLFLSDLPDMSAAVKAAYGGVFDNMGEVCAAGSRLLVERPIYDEFIERFTAESQGVYVPGDPLDPGTKMGPLVTKADQQRVLGMIETGRSEGARLVFGGDAPEALEPGAYVNPTLFADVDNRMCIAQQEIFGPVASVIPFDSVDEALAIANDTIYGLAAGLWTRDIDKAFKLVRGLQSGVVWVNTFDNADFTQPFGGYKQSGNARDKCIDSYKSYTQTKSAWVKLSG
ncbi:aldehyde dehydrogenase [Marinihelvus fidelis]|uniref:Aldehyde dehydrogenase n=1 Tax=Marinihelvus fidelis TaxID=2613842 RepID=A0A5N0T9N9_9GAMM|nr:aldehyde dehydrogenase [Marinihelvus fidelis]KAA9130526.1 aldehyde dehydrogenase [Marinihelvus fidelis]